MLFRWSFLFLSYPILFCSVLFCSCPILLFLILISYPILLQILSDADDVDGNRICIRQFEEKKTQSGYKILKSCFFHSELTSRKHRKWEQKKKKSNLGSRTKLDPVLQSQIFREECSCQPRVGDWLLGSAQMSRSIWQLLHQGRHLFLSPVICRISLHFPCPPF